MRFCKTCGPIWGKKWTLDGSKVSQKWTSQWPKSGPQIGLQNETTFQPGQTRAKKEPPPKRRGKWRACLPVVVA